jgi:hypothetical protein
MATGRFWTEQEVTLRLIMEVFHETPSEPEFAVSDSDSETEDIILDISRILHGPENTPASCVHLPTDSSSPVPENMLVSSEYLQLHSSSNPVEHSSDSDSEDYVPLENRLSSNNITLQKHLTPPKVNDFSEEFGPNISDTCQSHIDVFYCVFTDDIVNHLVLQRTCMPHRNKVAYNFNHQITKK